MVHLFRNKFSLFILLFICWCGAYSQDARSYFYENEVDVSIPVKNSWSMTIGAGNRGMLHEISEDGRTTGYQHEHLELSQFTHYAAKDALVLSFGLRYRFREMFDSSRANEFRMIEQVEYQPSNSSISLSHRLRLEQRFRENTIHRIRYDIGFSKPISENFSLGAGTEALYAVSANLKPEAEQRFSVSVDNTSFKDVELGLTLEYRLDNYARNPGHEFFISTGVSFAL